MYIYIQYTEYTPHSYNLNMYSRSFYIYTKFAFQTSAHLIYYYVLICYIMHAIFKLFNNNHVLSVPVHL